MTFWSDLEMASPDPSQAYSRHRNLNDGNIPPHPQHVRSISHSGVGASVPARRSQTYAAKAAAARLAQVMASHSTEDDEDDEVHNTSQLRSISFGVGSPDTSARLPRFAGVSTSREQSPRVRAPYTTLGESSALGASSNLQSARPVTSAWPAPHVNASQRTNVSTVPAGSLPTSATRVSEPCSEIDVPLPLRGKWTPFESLSSHTELRENGGREEAALRDKIDLLQEDNEVLLDKLRVTEEKLQEKEIRNKELEKQIAALGEGITMEARLLSRKEAALRQREAALRAAKEQTKDVKDDEIAALRLEADSARDEAVSATERASVAEKEVQGLRSVTRRMVLIQEEMEEMVLKRCWLARYWGLASRHGVLAEIASSKHEHWSALAPLPLEVVISAGHSEGNSAGHRKAASVRDFNDITGEANVECMLAVEKGLRELALLNVEQAVMLSIAQHHNPSLDCSELSSEEVEDVQFKQAWLVYFWRRAKDFSVERDIANERLSYWMTRSNQAPTSHDVVDVERGLSELHKLGVEEQLWEASRREVAHAAGN